MEILKNSTVAIFGIGGVGSFATESLARAGIYNLVLIDNDIVNITNINRQIHADFSTINKPKVEIMKERILKINPNANVTVYQEFFNSESSNKLISNKYNYIVDAIDSVSSKIELIKIAKEKNIPIISSMGARK